MNPSKLETQVKFHSGEIIEARQALFFIAAVLVLSSLYPLYVYGLQLGTILNLTFAASAFVLGIWSKTNPVKAFLFGLISSLLLILLNGLTANVFGMIGAAVFSLAFYRGWKYAKIQRKEELKESREDILDDVI